MSDKGYIKFAILTGGVLGVISGTPILNMVNYCFCLPIAIAGGGAVSIYLKGDQTRTLTTGSAALTGVIAAATAAPICFLLSVSIYLGLFFLAPGVYESLATFGGMANLDDVEFMGFPALSAQAVVLSNMSSTFMLSIFFFVVAPLSGVASLHLFHKDRIARA